MLLSGNVFLKMTNAGRHFVMLCNTHKLIGNDSTKNPANRQGYIN
jgi:hypothetical protein